MGGWANDFSGNAYEAHDVDAPRTYECEAGGCRAFDLKQDDGGTMEQCADCESYFCPTHMTDDKAIHTRVCTDCRHEQDVAPFTVERD